MQPVTCIAVDDEPWALALIRGYIEKMPGLTLVQSFEDAIAAGEFVRKYPVDILFADINMPDISGIDLVASLTVKPAIIFTTAYKKFAYEGFQLEAVDYLLKPISFERFEKAVKKAISHTTRIPPIEKEPEEGLFVWCEYRLVKIIFSQVDFIEAKKDYVSFHLTGSRPVLTLMPLKEVMEKLPAQKFIRVHRSYIVPIAHIKQVHKKKITLTSGEELPVGGSYSETLQSLLRP